MGRRVSYGGGQSSLGYLFGSGEAPKSTTTNALVVQSEGPTINKEPASKPAGSAAVDATKQIPAGIQSTASRNHFGSDGQNKGNFITPSDAASGPISPWMQGDHMMIVILMIVVDFVANCLGYSIMICNCVVGVNLRILKVLCLNLILEFEDTS
ncbi:protein SPIRAL1-like 1 [Capsicum annuum]|uniref:protein SPIRAL1-like 1 n=1 Tax=Capsicum annuum TaxID=4072 RepID=UPI001FB08636|nr:protein SPIRAL1-like 1 [Capsicum annuum]